jgi:serine/threonine kinase 38
MAQGSSPGKEPSDVGSLQSSMTRQKAAASRAFLENHYLGLQDVVSGRSTRPVGPREKELKKDDFELLKCIGRGAFGEVYVCRKVGDTTRALYAMKRMRKADMMQKKQVFHVRSERDVLAEAAAKNPWVVQLVYSFQDDAYLYMVMEYMQGGDLISWLVEKEIFAVDATRFYVAELCAAIASVHAMNFVHRDIKPDNILLDANGHIKLSDFGLCKRFSKSADVPSSPSTSSLASEPFFNDGGVVTASCVSSSQAAAAALVSSETNASLGIASVVSSGGGGGGGYSSPILPGDAAAKEDINKRLLFESIVGSPGYIAPEILLRQRYSISCDWWSVGVICFEMLYGCPPFYSEDQATMCLKITNWRSYLQFPPNRGVPDSAVDFMKRLLCDPQDRMSFDAIKAHPFFEGVDWSKLRQYRAAFIPQLTDPLDTRYFPQIDDRQRLADAQHAEYVQLLDPRGVMFADFKFNSQTRRR